MIITLEPFEIKLDRVPDLAQRPGPEEKLEVIISNTQYYPGLNLSQACKLFKRLDYARDNGAYTGLK